MALRVEYAVQESVTNIRRNLFITMAAIMVVAVSLALLGGVLLVRGAIHRTASLWTGNVRVTVFLSDDLSPDEKASLEEEIRTMPEVASVRFETKQQAYENFKRLFANQPEFVRNASPEALPESFRIQLKDPSKFTIIRDRLEGRPGLRIRDEREVVQRLLAFNDALRTGAFVISLIVLFAALLLIATTIRMAIYARRKEIGIMKLVGATNWFIRLPFMVEGMIQGAIGAVVALAFLLLAKPFVFSNLVHESLGSVIKFDITYGDIAIWSGVLFAVGVVVGALGSVLGLRRFLEV